MKAFLLVVFSYLIGSISSAYLASRIFKKIDIRTIGDRNAGGANVFRNISHFSGILVTISDIAKGAVPIIVAKSLNENLAVVFLCGLATVAGHNWPIFIGFKGGRGEAVTIGIFLVLIPKAILLLIALALFPFFKTRNLILTSAIIFAPLPFVALLMKNPLSLVAYSIFLPCVVGFTHFITTRNLPEEAKRESKYLY